MTLSGRHDSNSATCFFSQPESYQIAIAGRSQCGYFVPSWMKHGPNASFETTVRERADTESITNAPEVVKTEDNRVGHIG